MQIKVGQVFKDKDKRMGGRHIKIVRVADEHVWGVWCAPDGSGERYRTLRYSHKTLRTKFELILSPDAPDLTTQLYRVIELAKEHGYPGAAMWIGDNMPGTPRPQASSQSVAKKIAWIKQYREEKKCSLREAVDAYNAQL